MWRGGAGNNRCDMGEKKTCELKITAPDLDRFAPPATIDLSEVHQASVEFTSEDKILLIIYFDTSRMSWG